MQGSVGTEERGQIKRFRFFRTKDRRMETEKSVLCWFGFRKSIAEIGEGDQKRVWMLQPEIDDWFSHHERRKRPLNGEKDHSSVLDCCAEDEPKKFGLVEEEEKLI